MYSVTVRGHVMIAHSFRGELFGPAQRLHGATYVVDVELFAKELGAEGVVVDIGRAMQTLEGLLGELNYRNLDDDPAFAGKNTTTEYLAGVLFERLESKLREGALGAGSERVERMKVTLRESHVAWAAYEREVRQG
jgi:6-pyruvoyltetrahydropterin/6-carboxytetrahydropterin synthase